MISYSVDATRRALPLKWRNLSDRERAAVVNGCGGKGGWFNPPDYLFTASCDHHDFNYWLGGGEAERKRADEQFLEAMLLDSMAGSTFLRRLWMKGAAYRFYWAVRIFGGRYFYYRESPATWDDLEACVRDSDAARKEANP